MKAWLIKFLKRLFKPNPGTVRYAFSLAFLLGMFVGIASVITGDKSGIIIELSSASVPVGEVFSVDLYAEVYEPVNAVRANLVYPTSTLELVEINKTDSVISLWTTEPYVKSGIVYIEGGSYRRGFVGKHKLISLSFKVLDANIAKLNVTDIALLSGDGTGRELPHDEVRTLTLNSEPIYEELQKINLNEKITIKEISIFMADWTAKTNKNDFDNDGSVSMKDFSILLNRYFTQ